MKDEELLLKVVAGSHAYGISTPESDTDIRGLFYKPDDGIFFPAENDWRDNRSDIVYYNLKKYFLLARENNPNILELLYTEPEHVLIEHPAAKFLRMNRGLFLSTRARHTYSGYAHSQLKRMKNHKRWINNPQPEESPHIKNYCKIIEVTGRIRSFTEEDCNFYPVKYNSYIYRLYNSSDSSDIKKEIFTKKPGQIREYDDNLVKDFVGNLIVNREGFEKDYDNWKHYWEWKKKRNKKRGEMEEKSGYDYKFAAHAIRLIIQGIEILTEGTIKVYRPDREMLLEIRNGKWTYEQVMKFAMELEEKAKEIYVNKRYVVQDDNDPVKLNELYKKVVEMSS